MSKYSHIFNEIHGPDLAGNLIARGLYPLVDRASGLRFGWVSGNNHRLVDVFTAHAGGLMSLGEMVTLNTSTDTNLSSTTMLGHFVARTAAAGDWPQPAGDTIPVWPEFVTEIPLAHIDRNSIFPLGVMARGSHLICKNAKGDYLLSVRSNKVALYKGALDVTVGGLVSAGKTPRTALESEGFDEIGLSRAWLQAAIATTPPRTYEYMTERHDFPRETDGGIWHDRVYAWTVQVPDDFTPRFHDGEVQRMVCVTPEELKQRLQTAGTVKPNSAAMLLDDLLRSGHFDRDTEERGVRKLLSTICRQPDFFTPAA